MIAEHKLLSLVTIADLSNRAYLQPSKLKGDAQSSHSQIAPAGAATRSIQVCNLGLVMKFDQPRGSGL